MGEKRYTFELPSPVQKASPEAEILRKLRSFLDAMEPGLVYLLVNLWGAQGKAITYKELREAILAGDISTELFLEWQQDYSRFVEEHLKPAWLEAMAEAAKEIQSQYPEWTFDPMHDGIRSWVDSHAAEFVTNSTETQIQAVRAVVQRASVLHDINVDTLSRAIRPMVGLTYQQSIANMNYFTNLIQNGTSEKRAKDLSIRYAARQHRYRGYNIARTELAFAYNQGSYQATKQAQAKGYMGEVEKVWCTADDERVCDICGGLDGARVAMDEDFNFRTKLEGRVRTIRRVPPAHPSCRCGVLYKEISPPVFTTKQTENIV